MTEFSLKRYYGPIPKYDRGLNYRKTVDQQKLTVIAGPCSIESEDQINTIATLVALQGATHLRGGVFRAGTYPGKNFGLVDDALIKAYYNAAINTGLKNIIEVLDYTEYTLDKLSKLCSAFQVGARSQQNYALLRLLGKYEKPVFLKRHPGCTVDEWLGSAEHLLAGGVKELYLIERGSSTFHNDVRWTPCIHTIPSVKSICDIPVIVDASHGTGRSDLVAPLTLAGIAAGADGCLVEVHTDPRNSLSDPEQAITPKEFAILMGKVKHFYKVVRNLPTEEE